MASDPSPAGIEHQDIGLARISQELFRKATTELAADHFAEKRTPPERS
jgi:hypothetical protein